MLARVWGLVGLFVGIAGCASSTSDNASPPLTTAGGFAGFIQGAGGAGGTITPGTGSFPNPGGFGGVSGTPMGGTSGLPQGGTSGVAGFGNTPNTGGTPPVNVCGTVFKDCNGNAADGCETNSTDDAANCGACGVVCPPGANASPTCFVSKCSFACQPNWGDCDGVPDNGCETNLLTDNNNCGSCNFRCEGDGGTPCQQGGCECASESQTGKRVPLDIYVLFDQSGSMDQDVTGGTKWDVIKGALQTFVNNPASSGISIGIGYFPVVLAGVNPFCTVDADCAAYGPCVGGIDIGGGARLFGNCAQGDSCQPSAYKADVGIALLPGVAGAIVSSLNAHRPGGGTPTYPALEGSYPYVKSWATAHPNEKTILVLATDGNPSGCANNTVPNIANNLVAPAFAGNPSVMTFVIGVGNSLTSLNQIAQAGGTNTAFIVDTAGADPGGQFLAAMKAIETSVLLGCQYAVPTPTTGEPFDPSKVNVQFTPNGSTATSLGRVADANACTPTAGGWYYDNPSAPKQIILCPSSCTAINAGTGATVEIVLGCATHG
jgi:hypothetical protein